MNIILTRKYQQDLFLIKHAKGCKTCASSGVNSHIAGPIWVNLSEIKRGQCMHVLGKKIVAQRGQEQVGYHSLIHEETLGN